jgi:pSer/pThr/pTyr-binding forkhead associated (FHA) protein
MNSFQEAVTKIEKMIRASRLADLDALMKEGRGDRIGKIVEALSKLESGAYLIGCGPYTQGIYRLSAPVTVFGREAAVNEEPPERPLDHAIRDSVTFRPREVSRIHFKIDREELEGQSVYYITDLGSTCGTYLNGTSLEGQKPPAGTRDTRVSRPIADLDIISMGPSLINLFLFLIVSQDET